MFRFRISLKNGFRHKLNHPKQRKSPNLLLIPITYLSHYRFIHNMSYSENFKFPSLNSESHQNLGLMQVELFESEKITLPAPGAPITIYGITGPIYALAIYGPVRLQQSPWPRHL